MKPDEITQLPKIESKYIVYDVNKYQSMMNNIFLLLNTDTTEVMIVGPKHLRLMLSSHLLTLDCISVTSNTGVKDLGVSIDQDLSLDS